MRLNKYGRDLDEKPAGKFYLARRAGSKQAALYQQHWVG